MMEKNTQFRITPQLILGLTIVFVGTLFLFDNLGYIHAASYWNYWPVFIIVMGISKFFESGGPLGKLFGFALAAFGTLLLLDNMSLTHIDFWKYWPLLLIVAGVGVIWQVFAGTSSRSQLEADVRGIAVLGGFKRGSGSQDFRAGELTAILGGCEIDLRDASIQNGQAIINCFAFWGGIDIKVPEDWNVTVEALPIMGGFEDRTRHPQGGSTKQLIIRGIAVMGGVNIKN